MLCKTGSSILAQGLMENIVHGIEAKAFTAHTAYIYYIWYYQTFILSSAFSIGVTALKLCMPISDTKDNLYRVVSVSQFMKMKAEYHFKFEVFVLSCPSFSQKKTTLPWLGWPHCRQNGVGILFTHISVLNTCTMILFDLTFLIWLEKDFVMNLGRWPTTLWI